MRDLAERKFTASQVAATLGLSLPEFHSLRGVNHPDWRLPASKGHSKRDQRWSALDVIRLAVIRTIPYSPGPRERSRLFSRIKDEDLIAAYYSQEPLWLGIQPGEEAPLRCTDPRDLWQKGGHGLRHAAVVVHLTSIVHQVVKGLQDQEKAARES